MMPRLDENAVSIIGCNIATGIIVESLLKDTSGGLRGRTYYINGRTLYRNYVSCLVGLSDDKIKMFKNNTIRSRILSGFIMDTKIVVNALVEMGLRLVIYLPNYDLVSKKDPRFRNPDDLRGLKFFINKHTPTAVNSLAKEFPGIVKRTTHKLEYVKDMFITTHIGYDLLNFTYNSGVTLLESHTAEQKTYELWYTKYYKLGARNMSIFPFNEFLYMLLGDNELVKPENAKFRRWLYDTAIKDEWYATMKQREVMAAITKRDRTIGENLRKQFRSKF